MELSIELFLLDNTLMNLLMLRLASAISGLKLRPFFGVAASLFGAAYALLSLTVLPALNFWLCKLLLCLVAAIPLIHGIRDIPRALIALLAAACLTGGMLLGLCLMFGGTLSNGGLIGTVPVRLALLGISAGCLLPRLVRAALSVFRSRSRRVAVRIVLADRTLELTALADSGNLLTEPLSGKPVVIVDRRFMPDCGAGYPVPYATVSGGGLLYAVKPKRIQVFLHGWHAVDAFVAASAAPIDGVQAIIDSALLPKERGKRHDQAASLLVQTTVSAPAGPDQKAGALHTLRGDAAGTVPSGRGTAVDPAFESGRAGGEECAHRA